MPQVRAKMVCVATEPNINEQTTVNFQAVTSGSEENKSFSRWTPSANIMMVISNETPAAQVFKQGKEYYVDFTEVE
jgi:hypothetical protein